MRVNRTLLYAGIFLVAVGGVVVAADLGAVDEPTLVRALGLWPVAVIAIGLGLVLRHTRASFGGGMLAVAVPGLLLGSAFAAVPRVSGFCTTGDSARATQEGTFDGPASVSVWTDCGTLDLSMAPGSGWRLQAPDGVGRAPVVDATTRSLSVVSKGQTGWPGHDRNDWHLTLPATGVDDLSVTLNAGRGNLDLREATVDRLELTASAGEIVADASSASVANFSGEINVGLLSLHLDPSSDLTGSIDVNLAELQVCAPAELGLRVTSTGDARDVKVSGVKQSGSVWQSAGYATAAHHVNLEVQVDFGGIQINPIGGCK